MSLSQGIFDPQEHLSVLEIFWLSQLGPEWSKERERLEAGDPDRKLVKV